MRTARAAPRPAAHAAHLTYTRLTVEGTTIVCHVRLFRDDLQRVLRTHAANAALVVTDGARAEPLFARYFDARFIITADGAALHGAVTASGAEHDVAGQEMLWYDVTLRTSRPVRRLALRDLLMFETFADEQNLVSLSAAGGAVTHTFLFLVGDDGVQEVRL